ncbi:T-lymphocyte surface antigen Ly-9-like [Catharus ustulatus]|uniref:T-lymphocyte surface antigen Ly-9-like n=1 Tax=Catharus ustulatus TaxID=91951 RepID=UPI00140BADF1|nr:T-lymphocyte surface antigen Ly-9-like [Catharus ustulatus]
MSPPPMDEFWIRLLTALVLLHQTTSTSDTEEVSGTVGRSVIFRTQDMTDGNAFWNFGNDPIVTASFEDPPHALFSKPTFEKRFAVSEKGRALSISQLRLQDAGTYSVTIGEKRFTFILHVYRELAEPTVTCEAQNCSSDGNCRFSLRCSVSGTDLGNVSYTWREGDRPWDEGSMVLWVNKSDLEVLGPLRCTARNPVSNRSVTVRTPDLLCAGSLSSGRFWIWLIVTIGVVTLLSVLLLFLRKFRGWRKFRLCKPKPTDTVSTSEQTTMYAEVGPSQLRIPNGIKAKPTDGESAATIYSLVKPPDQVENGAVATLELI